VAWTALRWAWRIATNVFYLLVAWYVLDRLRGHTEDVIVPILGLIYVTMRTMGYGNVFLAIRFGVIIDDMNAKLNRLLDATYERDMESFREVRQTMRTNEAVSYVDLSGFGLIGLLCLWHLFTAI